MVSTHLKNISQIGSFPLGVKIKNIWNHQPPNCFLIYQVKHHLLKLSPNDLVTVDGVKVCAKKLAKVFFFSHYSCIAKKTRWIIQEELQCIYLAGFFRPPFLLSINSAAAAAALLASPALPSCSCAHSVRACSREEVNALTSWWSESSHVVNNLGKLV